MKILSLPEPYRQLCIDAYEAIRAKTLNTNTRVKEIDWVGAGNRLGVNALIFRHIHYGQFVAAYNYLPERYIIPPTIENCFTTLTELKKLIINYDQRGNICT